MGQTRNAHRADAASIAASIAGIRIGLVSGYDPDAYAVKCRVMPEDVETGWLKIKAAQVGAGFGFYCGPTIGVQAVIAHQEGDRNSGFVLGFLNDDEEDLPPAVPSGEIWAVHQSGSYMKFTADGKISVHGTVLISLGNLANSVKRFVTESFETLFNGHTHPSNGQPPTQKMDDSHMTQIVKGN